jgi:hypothetical protein
MTLWIENYSNKADNAGFKVNDLKHAALFAIAPYQYGIMHPCNILSGFGNKYKFTLKDGNGRIVAKKREIKKAAINIVEKIEPLI